MAKLTVKLPDDSALELEQGATGADAAAAIGPRLAKDALAVRVNGEVRDLAAPLADGERIEILTPGRAEALEVLRHDCAHVLATAVLDLWPGTKVSIGPPIERGFYYDFEFPDGFRPSEADLERIEERMAAHIQADEPFERTELSADDGDRALPRRGAALQGRADRGPEARRGGGDRVAVPERALRGPVPRPARALDRPDQGLQAELGRGRLLARRRAPPDAHPHLRDGVLLQAGARGAPGAASSRRAPATIAAWARSSACSRSCRRRPGCRSGCPRARCSCASIEREVRGQLERRGYVEIKTPQVLDEELWRRSGHWDNYREDMFFTSAEDRASSPSSR